MILSRKWVGCEVAARHFVAGRERIGTWKSFRFARAAALLACFSVLGCVPPIWSPISSSGSDFPMTTIEAAARLPAGWMSSTYEPLAGVWHFTRHGDELDQIYLRRVLRTAIVPGTNRTIQDGMTVQQIANLILDSRKLDQNVGRIEVVSNRPSEVDGRPCYRIEYRYRDGIGLPKRTAEYGCVVAQYLYRFEFNAPSQHYFDAHLGTFETLVESLSFKVPGA